MSLSIGIVGLPNVGKSTLFTALTKKQVACENYPFCTIEPNVGTVAVPDERLDKLAALFHSTKIVNATVTFVDIAGLVKGASQGEGLGNKFLSHIREVDAICHVIRAFEDNDIISVMNRIDPNDDRQIIELELILSDLEPVSKKLEQAKKQTRSGTSKQTEKYITLLTKMKECLESQHLLNSLDYSEEDEELLKELPLLTRKPIMYVLNIKEEQLADKETIISNFQKQLPKPWPVVAVCGKLEAQLSELSPAEVQEYLKTFQIEKTGLDQLIITGYKTLNLITFFTAGPTEAHAWTIKQNSFAPQAAGKIHTDFEKGFIRATVMTWQDLLNAGTEAKAKEMGLLRTEGKEYIVQDGDVIEIFFGK